MLDSSFIQAQYVGGYVVSNLCEIKIELTQRCPLGCVHCSTDSHRKCRSNLSKQTVIRVLREAAQMGAHKVVLSGGEPLLVNYLVDVVKLARVSGLIPSIYTSGIADENLTPMSRELAVRLRNVGLDRFIMSIYSDDANVHNSITRYPSHAATLTALRNAKTSGAAVELHFVAMGRNVRDLPNVVKLAASLAIERVSILRFVGQGRARNILEEALTPEDLRNLADSILALRRQYPELTIRAGSPFNILGICNAPCNAADSVLVIDHAANVFPCDAFKNVHYPDPEFGSVRHQSLQAVWQKSLFLGEVRRILSSRNNSTCDGCQYLASCQSGCLAQKVTRSGWHDLTNRPDPDCSNQSLATPAPPVLR